MKRFLKILCIIALSLPLYQTAHGQAAVFDAEGLANDIYQGGLEADQWVTQNSHAIDELFNMEKLQGWVNQYFGEGSTWQEIMGKVKQSRDMVSLMSSVNRATNDYITYAKYISKHFEELDPSVTAAMINRTSDLLKKVQRCYEAAVELVTDEQLSYGDKKKGVKDAAEDAEAAADDMENSVQDMINSTQSAKGATVALGILDGMDKKEIASFLSGYGFGGKAFAAYAGVELDPLKDPAEVEEGSITAKDVLGAADSRELSSGIKNAFKVISILMAFLMAGMLVFVLVKWNRGDDPRSEHGFFSIYVAIVVVSFILSILSGYIGYGL